jgi:hypothetical protein
MPQPTAYGSVGVIETAVDERVAIRALRRISWGAIFGGVVISLIVQFLLSMLGIGIGVTAIDPMQGTTPDAQTFSIAAGAWWTVSGIIAAFVGGWVAARLSGTPISVSATLHGLVTWATTMLVVFYLLTSATGALIGGALNVLGGAVSTVGQAVQAAVPQLADAAEGPMGDLRRQIESTVRGQDNAAAQAQGAAAVMRVVAGRDVPPAERDQAAAIIAQQGGISQEEARNRLEQWTETYQQNAQRIQQQARETAEATARAVSRAAIYGFIALVLGAVAGALGGRAGRAREPETVVAAAR